MILLKEVSTINLLNFFRIYSFEYDSVINIIVKNNILNFQDLKDYLEDNKNILNSSDISILSRILYETEAKLNAVNKRGKKLMPYHFNNYLLVDSPYTFEGTDANNFCDILIYKKDIILNKRINKLSFYTIFELKNLLGSVDYKKFNLSILKNVPISKIDSIITAINFYEEMVIRSYLTYNVTSLNYFTIFKNEKVLFMKDIIDDVIEYIMDNENSFNKSNLHIPYNSNNYKSFLINLISNYVTLKELEEDIFKVRDNIILKDDQIIKTKMKVIDRFTSMG